MYNSRIFFISLSIICFCLLAFALYLEHFKGLDACPLCIFQRIAYILIALVTFIAFIHNPKGLPLVIYKSLTIIIALSGALIAGRQVWLQHLPPELVPECGPGLDYMLNVFPFADAIKMALTGSGECAEVKWRFASLSIPEWSLVFFIGILVITMFSIFYDKIKN